MMERIDVRKERLQLTYPCDWVYKVVGKEREAMRSAIADVLANQAYTVADSKVSTQGTYCSLTVSVTVASEKQRDYYFAQLKNQRDIIMVL